MRAGTSSVSNSAPSLAAAASPTPATFTPQGSGVDAYAMQSPISAQEPFTKSGIQTRQKRVLPSRSRRGGPGVGNCDTDIMIVETMKRRLEGEPLIPANTRFILTTNSSLLPSTSESVPFEVEINSQAYSRYFERPEVQKAYREQQLIQTPEFTQLDEDANVGGRFRPRGAEDESADMSDAAYEKRHRKYETFEKRQRLREKEKLKHEQYKLKERIEQLRAMDTSAFLVLPSADFPEASISPTPNFSLNDDQMLEELSSPNSYGSPAFVEGERRRKIMLDTASSLEERYRVLLPPDRKWLEKKTNQSGVTGVSLEPAIPEKQPTKLNMAVAEASEEDEDEEDELIESDAELLDKLKPPPYADEDGESEVDFEERERERSKGLKLKIKMPPRTPSQLKDALAKQTTTKKQITLSPFMAKHMLSGSPRMDTHSPKTATSILTLSSGPKRVRAANGKFLPKSSSGSSVSLSAKTPPRKRPRGDSSTASTSQAAAGQAISYSISTARRRTPLAASPAMSKRYASHDAGADKGDYATCMLVVAAVRNSAAPNVRKTQRHVTAFGTRVPSEIEEIRDFSLPEWIFAPTRSSTWHDAGIDDMADPASHYMPQANGGKNMFYSTTARSKSVKQESDMSSDAGFLDDLDDGGGNDEVRIAYLKD
ncbi:uncharacterized protein FIBRA_00123 [Fibroporia radiculosa]|uniref:PEHE domain-containing protein n=1 Tax=Fibroporia radiculosa TaxID=599839 RepID=J7S5N8_9APHY|nr:uncharacterized protein FIBRA_00123 [Fibroporia radiculosa]CCL98129.1 predicted protein [Fibroporia radiculosa]